MNPYKEIARRHLTIEDLTDLLAEKQSFEPKKMSREDIEIERIIQKYGK